MQEQNKIESTNVVAERNKIKDKGQRNKETKEKRKESTENISAMKMISKRKENRKK